MDELLPWLSLKSVPGIGRLLFKRLFDQFSGPEQVFSATRAELLQVEGMTERLVRAVQSHQIPDWVHEEIERVQRSAIRIVTLADAGYPQLLREIPDPPAFLYVHGALTAPPNAIAIVGSRNATSYGINAARQLGAELATLGITIVSGMALGIDTAAHQGALDAGGKTVAVLGSGLLHLYPRQNRQLARQIAENGAVATEFELSAEPEAHHFPLRNRIISGMSLGTVVVEAAPRSGSLITARLALEQNREVFAVPGSINSYKSMGTHNLIKQGAKLVGSVGDILDEISAGLQDLSSSQNASDGALSAPELDLTENESQVLNLLEPYPIHIDELISRSGFETGTLSGTLLQLELKGLVQQTPGNYFNRITDRT